MSTYNPLDVVNNQKNLVKSNIEKMYAKTDTDLGRIKKSDDTWGKLDQPDIIVGEKNNDGMDGRKDLTKDKS